MMIILFKHSALCGILNFHLKCISVELERDVIHYGSSLDDHDYISQNTEAGLLEI